ncbi:hypothetical protein [uncultured Microbulbifer sp.]|uniref:hypothetical protein n=1 Tax=uncultured Microbulbifer sp. TaxID=348147 RepID=UPI002637A05D|nr:hypothetical protein [uncultured Microbulbifer sp.]
MSVDKVQEFFSLGLDKVASVIDGNKNYDQILGIRLNRLEYIEAEDEDGCITYLRAFHIFQRRISKISLNIHKLHQNKEIIAYGSTKNNKRELDFVSKLLLRNEFRSSLTNIHDLAKIEIPFSDNDIPSILTAIKHFLILRRKVSKGLLHQIINYAVAFFSCVETLKETKAKIFVVANDHSPVPVAFTIAARLRGIATLYVQHAEVTNIFPSNDFDFSIFRNIISREIYCSLSKSKLNPNICLPRQEGSLVPGEIVSARKYLKSASECLIVIYPSSVFQLEELEKLIKVLQANTRVRKVFIKPHPGFRHKEILVDIGVDLVDSIPDFPHIAICGNSSVVIELLANGFLVYQYFELDNISRDYYGFVSSRLVSSLDLNDCKERFWCEKSEENIISILGRYLPQLDTMENILERAREKLFFNNVLHSTKCKGRLKRDSLREYQLLRGLLCLNNSFVRDKGHISFDQHNDFWTITTLNSYFDARLTALNKVYECVDMISCESVLEFWLNSKKIEWTGYKPSKNELETLMSFVWHFTGDRKAVKWMETKMFDLIMRHGEAGNMINHLDSIRFFSFAETGINRRVAFTRFVRNLSPQPTVLIKYLESGIGKLTALEELKLSVQSMVDLKGFTTYKNFREVEVEFLKALPTIQAEYAQFVGEVYEQLGDRARFIDVARDYKVADDFMNFIKKKIKLHEGFSFIRLSDGEGYLFREFSHIFKFDDALNRERHWWGEHIPENVRASVIRAGTNAVKNADIIGIPSIYRFLRDHSNNSKSLQSTLQGRGLLSVLKGIKALDSEEKYYADDKSNVAIFSKIENIQELCKLANKVIVVSSGNGDVLKSRIGTYFNLVTVNVPTHYKTLNNGCYVKAGISLPYVFQDIGDKLKDIVNQGDLVLVGAGVAGKGFIDIAKAQSAIGLDLGSVMDQFLEAGIHSLY